MKVHFQNLAFLAAILAAPCSTLASEPGDPSSLSISQLLASAKSARAQGHNVEALTYYDLAIKRDPSDYVTLFQRGATYLSLGRSFQARADFDAVLKIRPGFEGALIQRAKLHARKADWSAARQDYTLVGQKAEQQLADLEEAEGAAYLAVESEQKGEWESCVNNAGVAIMTAGTALSLRQLRARCRFERGEIQEGISDLQHVLQIHPGDLEPHLHISSMLFYSLGDTERGSSQVKKCLQSDPDHKACKALHREEKAVTKALEKLNSLLEKRQFASAARLLVGNQAEEDPGLLAEVKENVASHTAAGTIHRNAASELYLSLLEKTCECYIGINSHKKAAPYCSEGLQLNPNSLHGLLHKAQTQLDEESFDAAIATLNTANEHHQNNRLVQEKLQEAQTLLKRSKTKDYYKVLGVSRDADETTVKKAYRKMTKEHHPDKVVAKGITKEEAEKKMAAINEAYEVLSDPELKARFDRGDDPNDPASQHGGNPFHGSPFGGQQFVFQQGGQRFQFQGNPFGSDGGGGGGGGGGGNPFGGFGGFPFG